MINAHVAPRLLARIVLAIAMAIVTLGTAAVVNPAPAEAARPCTVAVSVTRTHISMRITGRGATSGRYHFDVAYGVRREQHAVYYTSNRPFRISRPSGLRNISGATINRAAKRWDWCNTFYYGEL